nr:MAG TPA: hypothetical protein [Caudoviricetes sp.]
MVWQQQDNNWGIQPLYLSLYRCKPLQLLI